MVDFTFFSTNVSKLLAKNVKSNIKVKRNIIAIINYLVGFSSFILKIILMNMQKHVNVFSVVIKHLHFRY